MQSLSCLALAILQDVPDNGVPVQHDVHLMMIFMGIIMAGVLIGFIGVCVAGIFALRLLNKFGQIAERMEGKAGPLIDGTRAMMDEVGPKVRTIATNVEQISYTVRTKADLFSATADEINRTVRDANARTQAKVARVDGMVNEALNTAQHVSRTVQDSVRKPVQQIVGIVAAVKKGVETWVDRMPFKQRAHTTTVVEEVRTYEEPRYQARPVTQAGGNRTPPYDL
jgi:hypothetical protein